MPTAQSSTGLPRGLMPRLVFALAVSLGVLLAFQAMPGHAQARLQGADCGPNATARPWQATPKQHRAAIICLIAYERKRADRRELRPNQALTRLARQHNALMLAKECFRHTCPGELGLEQRLIQSDYLKRGGRFGYAEELGCAPTPTKQVMAWMGSRRHREDILGRRYRHIGVAFGRGAPQRCGADRGNGTYTVILAWRQR